MTVITNPVICFSIEERDFALNAIQDYIVANPGNACANRLMAEIRDARRVAATPEKYTILTTALVKYANEKDADAHELVLALASHPVLSKLIPMEFGASRKATKHTVYVDVLDADGRSLGWKSVCVTHDEAHAKAVAATWENCDMLHGRTKIDTE